jgi:signal transduction histidine kinase
LIFKIAAVAERLPPEKNRSDIETALDGAEKILAEGRAQIVNLRRDDVLRLSLPDALAEEAKSIGSQPNCNFIVRVHGSPKELNDNVYDELHRIGVEALTNAFRHSRAATIEMDIDFGDALFTLSVRDDGRGFEPGNLQGPLFKGHFGLVGMQERAARIGAVLEIRSRPEQGTQIHVRLRRATAYRQSRGGSFWTLLERILRGNLSGH